ncbi:MAG: hypothetical protein V4617_20215 [Gemmatimonadota bacterium]
MTRPELTRPDDGLPVLSHKDPLHGDSGVSARMRLELAFLDEGAPAPASPARDERNGPTLLVVAAEADLRRYVRECLHERLDLQVCDAATIDAAVALAAHREPALLIVDEPERGATAMLPEVHAIVLVDELPRGIADANSRVRLLARPFSADTLVNEVARLIG